MQQSIFSGCPNLKKVEFESGRMKPLKLRWSIFEKCGSLESFEFPDEIISEGMDNFFDYCSSLKTVILPVNGLTLLGKLMFRGCNVLTGLEVPASVTSFGNDLFYDCKFYDLSEDFFKCPTCMFIRKSGLWLQCCL